MRDNTQDLAKFGRRELAMARDLLDARLERGLPMEFTDGGTTIEFNPNSGLVFFTNDHYEVAIMEGEQLVMWHVCSGCGREGTRADLNFEDGYCEECKELR